MTEGPVTAVAAQRTLLLLTATRWFPVGLVIGLVTLLMLERGLSVGQVAVAIAAQGIVLLALELPTGGLADALGRRPVLIVAWGLPSLPRWCSCSPRASESSSWPGPCRASSGPWTPVRWRPGTSTPLTPRTSRCRSSGCWPGPVPSSAWPSPSALSVPVVWSAWAPSAEPALLLPFGLAIAVNVAHLVLTVLLVRETCSVAPRSRLRRVVGSVRSVPRTVADGVGLLRTAPVLRSVVLVEVFWSVAMIAFETFNTVRLAELVSGEKPAGVIIGPVSAVSWGLFAAGAALGGLASRRIGVAWTALLSRVLNGAFVVGMGLAAGPVGLIAAFLAAYTLHGTAGPMHNTLLHRQAGPANRRRCYR